MAEDWGKLDWNTTQEDKSVGRVIHLSKAGAIWTKMAKRLKLLVSHFLSYKLGLNIVVVGLLNTHLLDALFAGNHSLGLTHTLLFIHTNAKCTHPSKSVLFLLPDTAASSSEYRKA